MISTFLFYLLMFAFTFIMSNDINEFEQYMPSRCESCRLFAREVDADAQRLARKMSPDEAEAWLIEEQERLCARMLSYRLHKDRRGLARFAKEQSGTAKVVKQLKERGVEVRMDVAEELLDMPSVESGRLKDHCEWILEEFETDIEHWFFQQRHKISLENYLCQGRLADEFDGTCAQQQQLAKDEL